MSSSHNRDIPGAWNFRDVGGSGVIEHGRLFRSSELAALSGAGRDVLTQLGVTDVADLRSKTEVRDHGTSAVPDDVTVHQLALDGEREAPHEQAFAQMLGQRPSDEDPVAMARNLLIEEYRRLAGLPGTGAALRAIMLVLAGDGRLVVSCFAGKDRTGILVAILLEAIGVDHDSILEDYLISNEAAPQLRDALLLGVQRRHPGASTELLRYVESRLTDQVLGVSPEYLHSARDAIDDEFGSLSAFLRAASITDATVNDVQRVLIG